MADRKDQTLVVYDENGKQLAQGNKGENSVELTGLVANTAYRPAQFYVAYVDGNNVSPKVALPAFQTLAEPAPVTSKDQNTGQPQSDNLNKPASDANSQPQKETPSDSASQSTSDSQSKAVSASQAPSENSNTSSDAGQAQPASDSKSVSSSSNNNQSQE